jgi:hypothetical protein
MFDREIGGTLLEVVHRVTALLHDTLDKAIGLGQRISGLVDEVCLRVPPRSLVTLPCSGAKGADLELLMPLGTLRELGLCLTSVPLAFHRPFVLRSELFLKLIALALLAPSPHQPQNDQHNDR